MQMVGNDDERVSRYNSRAKRLFIQEAINLAIAFPYLAPVVERCVFSIFKPELRNEKVKLLADQLLEIGIRKLYPDAIAHGLYLALNYTIQPTLSQEIESSILAIDDCIVLVLFREYALRHNLANIITKIEEKALSLQLLEQREQDRFWLLLYQVYTAEQLIACGQDFLGKLKIAGFSFIKP